MKRLVKTPEQRRADLLEAAERTLRERGLEGLSIDEVTRGAGVAKGTFYLHFDSRQTLLAALAMRLVTRMADAATAVGAQVSDPPGALMAVLTALKAVERQDAVLAEALHRPENRELREWCDIALVQQLGPPLAAIVERGCAAGDFRVGDALSTVQLILAGQAFLLGNDRFGWTEAERQARELATLVVVERALGAAEGRLQLAMAQLLTSVRASASPA